MRTGNICYPCTRRILWTLVWGLNLTELEPRGADPVASTMSGRTTGKYKTFKLLWDWCSTVRFIVFFSFYNYNIHKNYSLYFLCSKNKRVTVTAFVSQMNENWIRITMRNIDEEKFSGLDCYNIVHRYKMSLQYCSESYCVLVYFFRRGYSRTRKHRMYLFRFRPVLSIWLLAGL